MITKNIDIDLIKDQTITVATPMFGGNAFTGYVQSMIELTKICTLNNIKLNFLFVKNESLITRGRNNLVHIFLKTDSNYLFFVDADISFNPLDFLYMVQLAESDKEKQIICGAYPKKRINWDFIKKAEEKKLIKSKEDYSEYQSEYVLNHINPLKESDNKNNKQQIVYFDPNEPLKVFQSGTGFMLIAKDVFYKFKEKYPEQKYIDEDGEEKIAFFDCKIDPETKDYMSEDWMFCSYANKISIYTWVLPWISLNHFGTYEFIGNFKSYSENYKKIIS